MKKSSQYSPPSEVHPQSYQCSHKKCDETLTIVRYTRREARKTAEKEALWLIGKESYCPEHHPIIIAV